MAQVPDPNVLSLDPMGRVAPPIVASVGRDGVNRPEDVFVVQELLDDRLPRPHSPVKATGTADIGTILAIEAYQAVMLNMVPPSGRVDPQSPTYWSLANRPLIDETNKPVPGHYGVLPPDVVEAAEASRLHWRVPASVTLAQWVVESAWGAAMPPGSNNPFGIKAVGDQAGVESQTREVVNGDDMVVEAKFRRFDSIADAFDAHGRLLATAAAYKPAMAQADNPEAFADALTGVYATDPQYGFTLKWVMHNYGFGRYDK